MISAESSFDDERQTLKKRFFKSKRLLTSNDTSESNERLLKINKFDSKVQKKRKAQSKIVETFNDLLTSRVTLDSRSRSLSSKIVRIIANDERAESILKFEQSNESFSNANKDDVQASKFIELQKRTAIDVLARNVNNSYDVLKIDKNIASTEKIKKAYKKLTLLLHLDKNKFELVEAIFQSTLLLI